MTDDSQSRPLMTLNGALATGFETADFEAVKALYTDESVLLPPRSRPVKGRQAIAAFWTGVRNRFSGMTFTSGEWKPLGDAVARETGTYEMAAGEGGGARGAGKFMMVWQKIDGEWQVESSIWSVTPSGEARRPGQGGGAGARAQGRGGQAGGGQGGGQRQGGQGGYRQGGGGAQGGGGYGAGGGRPRGGIGGGAGVGGGGAGVIGAGRRGGQPQGGQRGQGGGPGQNRRGQSLYDDNPGLYSNQDD